MLPRDEKTRRAPVDSAPALLEGLREKARQVLRLIEGFGLDALDQHLLLMGCLLALGNDSFRAAYARLRPLALWHSFLSAVEDRLPRDPAGRASGPEYLRGLRAMERKVAGKVRPLLQLCDGVRDLTSVDCRSLPLLPESLGGKAAVALADFPEACIAEDGDIGRRAKGPARKPDAKDLERRPPGKGGRALEHAGIREPAPAGHDGKQSPKEMLPPVCPQCGAPRSGIKETSISARGAYACGAIYIAFSGPRQAPLIVRPCGGYKPRAPRPQGEPDFLGE